MPEGTPPSTSTEYLNNDVQTPMGEAAICLCLSAVARNNPGKKRRKNGTSTAMYVEMKDKDTKKNRGACALVKGTYLLKSSTRFCTFYPRSNEGLKFGCEAQDPPKHLFTPLFPGPHGIPYKTLDELISLPASFLFGLSSTRRAIGWRYNLEPFAPRNKLVGKPQGCASSARLIINNW